MRYSYEFKRKCVALYRQGCWPEAPDGIKNVENFRKMIRSWVRLEDACGPDALRHKRQNKEWTAEERYLLIAKVLAGQSYKTVALTSGINPGQLYQWVRKYKELGYNGLVNIKKGRPSKEPQMKKKVTLEPLTESEREELIRLREETEYLRTELAVRKKLEALSKEKEAAQLKAKKQRLSRNSENKDTN
ncbi:MAG: helix-turn-helix domain-containing protein [Firmicutes bacterium]|nr:helix-turn-helix domain-containing protein [Bacillota bacterium]